MKGAVGAEAGQKWIAAPVFNFSDATGLDTLFYG
jgi:hypothetical protein